MRHHRFSTWLAIGVFSLFTATSQANDLDDGIGFDGRIKDDLEEEVNMRYIIMKAKGKAKNNAKKGKRIAGQTTDGVGNINFGPGARIRGATIINLSNNKGAASISRK